MAPLSCAEMVRRCQEMAEAGWRHFTIEYLPFASAALDRHYPELADQREALLCEVLRRAREDEGRFFRDYRGQSEREFLLHFRELVVEVLEAAGPPLPPPEIVLDWDTFATALKPLSPLEKQVLWMYVLNPREPEIALLLRMEERSVAATQQKAQEVLRLSCDRWSADLLEQNRHSLARHARRLAGPECPEARIFLRLLDGQITWQDRAELERHLDQCWCCVDRLCRFREVLRLFRLIRPFTAAEALPYFQAMGLPVIPPSRWKRLLGVG